MVFHIKVSVCTLARESAKFQYCYSGNYMFQISLLLPRKLYVANFTVVTLETICCKRRTWAANVLASESGKFQDCYVGNYICPKFHYCYVGNYLSRMINLVCNRISDLMIDGWLTSSLLVDGDFTMQHSTASLMLLRCH